LLEPLRGPDLGVGQILSWSADSRLVVLGASSSPAELVAITAVDVDTGETRRITTPPSGTRGDSQPSVSPDGRMLAFVRRSGVATGALYVQALGGPGSRRSVSRDAWGLKGSSITASRGARTGAT
jgi:Tol biopolymer transport system component